MNDHTGTGREPLKAWVEALGRADADVAAGRVCDGAAINAELQVSVKRMESGATPAPTRAAAAKSVPRPPVLSRRR